MVYCQSSFTGSKFPISEILENFMNTPKLTEHYLAGYCHKDIGRTCSNKLAYTAFCAIYFLNLQTAKRVSLFFCR